MGLYASDGRLLISFRDTAHDSPTKGDWVAWVGTYDDIVQGREGQYRVRLMDNHKGGDCAYPAVERLPDGAFVVTAYGHWTPGEAPWIASVRLLQRASPSTCRHRTGSTANTRLSQALVSNTCPPRSTTVQRPATLDACTGLPGGFLGKSQTNVSWVSQAHKAAATANSGRRIFRTPKPLALLHLRCGPNRTLPP